MGFAARRCSSAQVLQGWATERESQGLAKLCGQLSTLPVNVLKNTWQVWDFSLSAEDLALIDKLDKDEEKQNTMAGWLREHDPDFY